MTKSLAIALPQAWDNREPLEAENYALLLDILLNSLPQPCHLASQQQSDRFIS
ncbi:hypothetical protein H6G17_27210 [Chroococcidiopsis sp. FACHB-1243]|uniref:hypothetical protein n=1 Tax=Chroococcidiopsis sp. [FACHB-1243] TaxID=2692781 RepID=UPI00177C4EF6|nr:hypothetical protein [Chroococcidiopsis sp. [FACHB-1243]]MBD2309151.1 hypothetical protein [Chroococcidiopsis sp. [FACHB-1243]]